ncbi:MAG TPA: AAA family ATPase [Sulfuriferula sp.]|nr:AAA family ATPase [Sulfuriferula sp.]
MKLKRLSIRNFMPYKGDVVLDFPQDASRNTLIVFGDNMRGKTSLLNAIRWTFYGNAMGRHLRPILLHQMPNREAASAGDWTMETRIEFEADGCQYDLRRVAEKKSLVAKPERPEDFLVSIYMQKNGAALPGDEIDAEINQFSPEQVSRFFLFDGELLQEYEELLIEGSEQGKKIKEAIEQALGVPALINGRDDISAILKKAQKLQAQEASQIKGMEGVSEGYLQWTTKRERFEADTTNLQTRYGSVRDERLALDDELEKVDGVYRQKNELDFNKSRCVEIEEEIKQKTLMRLQLAGQAWCDLLAPRLIAKREALSLEQKRVTDLIGKRIRIQALIGQTTQYLANSVCPTCNQPTAEEKRVPKERELENLRAELHNLGGDDQNLADVTVQLQTLSKLIGQGVGERLSDTDKDLARLERDLAKIENKIEDLREKTKGFDTDEIMKKRSLRDHLYKDEARISLDIEDRKVKINEADKELRILSQRMTMSNDSQRGARGAQMVDLCEKLYASFSLSIERLREALRQTVQTKASEAFREMSTQKAYQGLQINENYGLTILDQNGQEVPLRSAGAEQIVALSLIDGLSHAGRTAGPVVMDTPFGRLDTKHRKNILAYLPNSASQLILFVHDGEIRGTDDLDVLAHRIGGRYEIKEISPSHSVLERR